MAELYPVIKNFADKEDNKRSYQEDTWYPRFGFEASEERVEELQDMGYIGVNEEPEDIDEGFPRHTGGGHYELSNGEKVKGREEAEKAEEALQK
ncbi:hypothetical protein [Jeotgalicoccus sp. FSL K6-3177]|uniref:hypothetical protein n=1 Tax=Jeotgalicoccus sp. FSL K6-3177 TaxID=2921494 RepID=UPI0030FD9B55